MTTTSCVGASDYRLDDSENTEEFVQIIESILILDVTIKTLR